MRQERITFGPLGEDARAGNFDWLRRLVGCALVAIGLAWMPARAAAQFDEPAEESAEEMPAGDAFDAESADNEPGEPAADAGDTAPEGAEAAEADAPTTSDDPAVNAVLETRPSKPRELVRAILVIIDLGHAPAARGLVRQLAGLGLDDAALAELATQFGPADWLKLGLATELGPQAADFARRVAQAAQRVARDPARLDEAVKKLGDANIVVRDAALVTLRRARGEGAARIVAALLADEIPEHREALLSALIDFGPEAVAPVEAALDARDQKLAADLAQVLGESGAVDAIAPLVAKASGEPDSSPARAAAAGALVRLLGQVPDAEQSHRLLLDEAEGYASGRLNVTSNPLAAPPETTADGQQLLVWLYRPSDQQLLARSYTPGEANLRRATQRAYWAYRLSPEDPATRQLYALLLLETQAAAARPASPLAAMGRQAEKIVSALGVDEVNRLLPRLIAEHRLGAATVAARYLGQQGDQRLLYGDAQPLPLVQAAGQQDRALRLAAVEAILSFEPWHPFAGDSEMLAALGSLVSAQGVRAAVVGSRDGEEAARLAGLLAQIGFEARPAVRGTQLVEMVTETADCELVLLHADLVGNDARDTLAFLRTNPRTRLVPVAIVATPDDEVLWRTRVQGDPRSAVFVRPHTPEAMRFEVDMLLAQSGLPVTTPEERLTEAERALDLLVRISAPGASPWDLRGLVGPLSDALYVHELGARAALVLGRIGRRDAQKALVDLASHANHPLELRRAAAAGFDASIRRFGILLTTPEIWGQYEIYNQAETLGADTQAVLSALLDSIEQARPADRGRAS